MDLLVQTVAQHKRVRQSKAVRLHGVPLLVNISIKSPSMRWEYYPIVICPDIVWIVVRNDWARMRLRKRVTLEILKIGVSANTYVYSLCDGFRCAVFSSIREICFC